MTLHTPGGTVPPIDSANNVNISDAVGNKDDTEAGNSVLARQVVPLVDQANNDWASDVGGNKLDTVAGTSAISLARVIIADVATAIADIATAIADIATVDAAVAVIDGYHDVPGVNSADNDQMRDVLGQKGDGLPGDSLYALAEVNSDHIHGRTYVLPNQAAAIPATAGNGWAYGIASNPLGTPGDIFDVHWIEAVAGNNNAEYQAAILVDGVLATEFSFVSGPAAARSKTKRVQMPPNAAAAVTIQLASSVNGATATFKVEYHTY